MFSCNITLILATIETESTSLCDYVNYHMVMFVMCISVSAILLSISVISIAYYGPNATPQQIDSIERCTKWALAMLLLSFGVDGAFIVFYFICFVLVFATTAYVGFNSLHQVMVTSARVTVARVMCSRRSNLIVDSSQSSVQVVIISTSCPICLETDNGPWHTTSCGHVFHPACINRWRRETCPLCRAVIGMRR